MVLDDIGEEPGLSHELLGAENALLVVLREAGLPVVPSVRACAEDRLLEVKHTGEISAFPDKIRNLFLPLVEDLSHREGIVTREGSLLHLAQELTDPPGILQHVVDI